MFLLEEQPAWSPAPRSSATSRKAPTRHLLDAALVAAALDAEAGCLLRDPNTLGALFESFVYQHLLVFGANIHHYRDSNGLEVDAVLQTAAGDWAALEVRLGIGQVDTSAPAALVVVVPTGYAYLRPDGVSVVPLSLLGP